MLTTPIPQKLVAIHAHRRLLAKEIANILRVRRTLKRLRTEIAEGLSPTELIETPRGRVPRWQLLAFSERVYRITFVNIIEGRKALFREQGHVIRRTTSL